MEFFINLSAQIAAPGTHHALMPHWIIHLGALGLFSVAVVDSSIIPLTLPGSTDLLLLWLVAHGGEPWVLVASAIVGSFVGGYMTWQVGKKGGEAALRRYISARMLGRITLWIKRHPVLAVFLPALLPPPIPLSPFVLAAGALSVSRNRFLAAFGAARCLRYSLIAWLGASYGRTVMHLWSGTIKRWSGTLLWTFGGLLVVGICLVIWKARSLHRTDVTEELALRAETARVD
jgi:membrane protein YqaA with SNARE-associated domain